MVSVKNTLKPVHFTLMIAAIMFPIFSVDGASAQDQKLYVRIAKIEVYPAQLQSYNAALKEHAETAVRVEHGVLMLNGVADKANPTQITVFEIYASIEAYKIHITTPHFLKYKTITKDMVKSLQLVDVDPIVLASKMKQ